MSSHITSSASSQGPSGGVALKDLPKSWTFTANLPTDSAFPSPAISHKTARDDLGPRMVKGALFTWVRPEEAVDPELLGVSTEALKDLGINPEEATTEEFRQLVAGNRLLGWNEDKQEGGYPWAQCYGGWQFGSWAGQLGDGRAISLFETTNPETKTRYELQLKGAGITPYSRFADGKAVLRSSIREFVVSEALNALHIPTTRALSLTLLPHSKVRRESTEPGAIVARFAQSWLRIGTFDLLRARGDRDLVRKLADYTAEHVFSGWSSLPARLPDDQEDTAEPPSTPVEKDTIDGPAGLEENRYTRLYREITRRNAKTVAAWQAYAFTNGVLNTDNTSIMGLSLDFGPFAFLDTFDPNYTPNHDDGMLRYSYRNQPTIIWWNLVRLGETLGELIGSGAGVDAAEFVEKGVRQEDADELVSRAEGLITRTGEEYKAVFLEEYKRLMTARLGLKVHKPDDFETLFSELLDTMEALQLDFNQFFRRLSGVSVKGLESEEGRKEKAGLFFHAEGVFGDEDAARERVGAWLDKWRVRVVEDWATQGEEVTPQEEEERQAAMKAVNPNFIPRSWILDEVIRRVEKEGERDVLGRVMKMALNPFEETWGGDREEEESVCPVADLDEELIEATGPAEIIDSPLARSNIAAGLPMYVQIGKAGQSNLSHVAPLSSRAFEASCQLHQQTVLNRLRRETPPIVVAVVSCIGSTSCISTIFIMSVSLLTGTIDIIKNTKTIYKAFKDAKGLPKQFHSVAEKFPLVLEILRNAEKKSQTTELNDEQTNAAASNIRACHEKVEALNKIFKAVLPEEGANRMERYKKAVAALGKGKRVEELMGEIMRHIELVTSNELIGTATEDEIKKLQEAIQEMIDMSPSISDDGGSITQHNSGGGSNIASRVTNNNIGEGSYTNSNTGGGPQLNHNGPGTFNYNNYSGSEKSTSLLQSLHFREMDLHRKDISNAVKNTCRWIYDVKDYKDWLARRQRLLWIVGIPGSGKSTIMDYVCPQDTNRTEPKYGTQKLPQPQKELIVASFFCYSAGAILQRTRIGLFRSLLHKILQNIPTVPSEFISEFDKNCQLQGNYGEKWEWHERDLEQMIQTVILYIAKEYPDQYTLRIYVDALDEFSTKEPNSSKEPRELAEYFQGLVSQSIVGIDLQVCISCRDYPFIAKGGLKISIGNKNHQDILAYVQTKLSGIFGESDGTRELMDWIATKASGIFQWAVIVVERAQEFVDDMGTDSPKRILKQLEHLPQGLDKLYEKSFQTMERPRRLQSLRLLRWICFAKRPLSVKELYDVMASEPSSMPWSKAVDCDINEMANMIKSFSCNLAAIIEDEEDEVYSTVEPRHQSVYDYLVSSGLQYLDDNALGANSPPSSVIGYAHLQLSRYCVKYLSSKKALTKCHNLNLPKRADRIIEDWKHYQKMPRLGWTRDFGGPEEAERELAGKEVAELEDEFPFFLYAASAWAYHANIAENENPDQEELLKFYQELINMPFKKLDQVRIWVDYQGILRPTTLLHIASAHHLPRLVKLILKIQNNLKNASIADDIRQYGMPDTVGINMAIHGSWRKSPLQLAVDKDDNDVVELLLQHSSIDVNVLGWTGETVLTRAICSDREDLVGMLLQHSEIDVNARDSSGQTPLLQAALNNREGIVTMLLQHREINVNAKNAFGMTALSLAVEEGPEGMVRVPLETRKADIEISPDSVFYPTPLIVAVQEGHWTIVELLLKFRGRMSEADKQVARALEKLPPDERNPSSPSCSDSISEQQAPVSQYTRGTQRGLPRRKAYIIVTHGIGRASISQLCIHPAPPCLQQCHVVYPAGISPEMPVSPARGLHPWGSHGDGQGCTMIHLEVASGELTVTLQFGFEAVSLGTVDGSGEGALISDMDREEGRIMQKCTTICNGRASIIIFGRHIAGNASFQLQHCWQAVTRFSKDSFEALAMNPTTAATEAGTNATTGATTNTTPYSPTDPFSNNDADKNVPLDNDANKTASTAPLLPTYSFAVGQPPPQASWTRRMTGGLTTLSTKERLALASEHPGVFRIYSRRWWMLIVQWFFTFWVLGATATCLSRAENLPSAVPFLAYIVTCAGVHVVLMYFFSHDVCPTSPTNPRPGRWHTIAYAVSSLAWFAALACVVLVLIKALPFDGEEEDYRERCRNGRKCYPATHNAQISTYSKMNIATGGFIIISIIGQWYQIFMLWRGTFTTDEKRVAYELWL
ncbi:hypothetical protein V490_01932 [Pseudogymnoascus sp. VKM F-3557]|nr:hypothetical protein V490_01932 [Pseudogymnoascus sp. VKM F-3557]